MVPYHTIANVFLSGLLLIMLPILLMNSAKRHFMTGTMIRQFILDVNANYAITPKFRVYAEANNLLNQPLYYYQGISSRLMQAEYYNVRFSLV
jgi:hypothetical protein